MIISTKTKLRYSDITVDRALQMRAEVDPETVKDYAAAYRAGVKMPPLTVFYDGCSKRWLADGFQRYEAAKMAVVKNLDCEEFRGTRRDALAHSIKANATHGARRTNADKRKAVHALLDDPEWAKLSLRDLAQRANVTAEFVRKIKTEVSTVDTPAQSASSNGKGLQESTQSAKAKKKAPKKPENEPVSAENVDYFIPDETGAETPDQAPASTPAGAASAPPMPGSLPWLQAAHDAHKPTRAIHDRLCELVREWEALGQEAHPQIHEQSITAHLKAVVFEIHQGQPYAVCPCCQGQGTCREQLCHKAGWLNKSKFDNLPRELKIGAVTLK